MAVCVCGGVTVEREFAVPCGSAHIPPEVEAYWMNLVQSGSGLSGMLW